MHWDSGNVMEAEWELFPAIKEMGEAKALYPGALQGPAWYQNLREPSLFHLFSWLLLLPWEKHAWASLFMPEGGQEQEATWGTPSQAQTNLAHSWPTRTLSGWTNADCCLFQRQCDCLSCNSSRLMDRFRAASVKNDVYERVEMESIESEGDQLNWT